jgi:hypothetical protein
MMSSTTVASIQMLACPSAITLRADFPCGIDERESTLKDLPSPAGINGGQSRIGGIGPIIIRAKTGELLIDPGGLYLVPGEDQPNFRVLAAQRLKSNGVRLVGCFKNTDDDVLQDRKTKYTVTLSEEGSTDKKILVLETVPCPTFINRLKMNKLVEQVRKKNLSALIPNPEHLLSDIDNRIRRDASTQLLISGHLKKTFTTMIFNEANVSVEERSRLYVRRLGFCNSKLLTRMTNDPDNGTLPKLIQLNECEKYSASSICSYACVSICMLIHIMH